MIITLRLTKDNLDELHEGDVFTDDPGFGYVRSARLTRDGQDNAMVYMTNGERDILGLPQTALRITR